MKNLKYILILSLLSCVSCFNITCEEKPDRSSFYPPDGYFNTPDIQIYTYDSGILPDTCINTDIPPYCYQDAETLDVNTSDLASDGGIED